MFSFFKINDLEYGRGTGSSKKVAKAEAAKKTLEMLIPEIRDKLPSLSAGDAEGDAPDLSFFDGILVEDSRVADLCNRTVGDKCQLAASEVASLVSGCVANNIPCSEWHHTEC